MDNSMSAEKLHDKLKTSAKQTGEQFVNPGTSPTPFVGMENRRHGKVMGGNQEALRAKANNPNEV